MIITDIKKGRKYLSSVYIDGELAVKLDTRVVLENGIRAGLEIDDEKLKEYIDLSNTRRAKEKALWLISSRDHSKKELIDKIAKTSDKESARMAADRMEELGLVNDEKFARRYLDELLNIKHLSKRGAKYKLIQKGIDKDLIDEILEDTEVDPKENIRAVIEKKYFKNLSDEKVKRRCIAALQRMGYGYSDINSVIKEYIEDEYYNEF
ncbi:MAG: regulatory protein RecX [Ruminococcus sp.]|nr:regulatory protein RecX [Ruminococcus sp.]